jgi:hypothetical protein
LMPSTVAAESASVREVASSTGRRDRMGEIIAAPAWLRLHRPVVLFAAFPYKTGYSIIRLLGRPGALGAPYNRI